MKRECVIAYRVKPTAPVDFVWKDDGYGPHIFKTEDYAWDYLSNNSLYLSGQGKWQIIALEV